MVCLASLSGRPSDPFHYLGPHVEDDGSVLRAFLPDAEEVAIVELEIAPRKFQPHFGRHLFLNRRPQRLLPSKLDDPLGQLGDLGITAIEQT